MTKEEKEELARQKEYEDFRGPIDPPKKGSLREQQNAYDNQMISWYKNDRNNLAYTDDTTPIHVSGEWEDYGESSHDSFNVMNPNEGQGELNEMRASDQGFWEKIGLGAAKMTTTAASTFLDGTVGFLYGVGSAIKNGDASRIWDNDFTNAMQDFNEWCEEKMPHYSSRYEGWGTDFWGNFIGKDILQNLGFQIGTAGALIVPTGIGAGLTKTGLSLTKNLAKFTKLKNAKNLSTAFKDLISNTYSAVGESTIEGLQNKRDFVKYQNQINDDNFIQQNNILDRQWAEFVRNNYNGDERMAVRSQEYLDYVQKKNQLLNDKKNKERFIQQEADKVGDMTFMANMVIVGLSNYVTFGKAICGGMGLFKRSIPTVTDIVDRKTKEVLKKNVSKNTAKEVINKGKFAVKDKTTGKTVLMDAMTQERGRTKSTLINTIKDAVSEGLEEMNQSVASEWFAGAAEEDMLQYDALTRNGMAYDDVVKNINNSWMSWGNMAKAMKKVYTDPAQWRQFFSGIIGVGFSPHFQKGADGKLHFKLNNIGEQNAEINAYNSSNAIIAENINNILNSEKSQNYIRGLVRHSALDDAKRSAVALDSKMDFQDADFAQFVSDISMLSDAGKLDLLRAQLENMKTLTDEELEDYCTKLCNDVNGKKVGEFVDSNGNYIGTSDQARMEIRKKINSRVDQLLYDMETYQRSINEIDDVTGGHLSKHNLATFAWEKANLQNKFNRAKSILGSDSSARNIASVKDKLGLMLKTNTDQLKSVKESLNKEKQRIADANKMSESAGTAKIDKSDFQKKLEADIETLTQNINIATEVSQLIADLEAMQSQTQGSSPMADIKKLFSKYADFRDSMPEVAKMFELSDDESLSLEYLMYSGQLNKFLGLVTKSTIDEIELDNDYQDCAKLYKRGLDIEKSLDNMLKNPERYESERTEMERKIIERENADTIKTIEDEIKKVIDNGLMNFGNIDEKTKEIIDNLKSAKNEKNVGRRLFRNSVNMLRDTPFDSLRKIALENVLNSKKYKYLRDFAKFVNYVNVRIAMSKASPDALMIAQKTFTEFIKDKKTVEECLKAKIKLDDIDVSELYKDNYTPETYANAQLVKNEVFKMFETIFKDFAMDYYSPKLNIDKYDSGNILPNSEAVKANEVRKQIDKVKNKLTKYVDDFSGDILSTEDQENIFKHIDSVIEEEFAETNYEDPTNLGLDSAKLELKTFMYKYLLDNANKRLTNLYDNKANNIEELKRNKEIIAKAKAKINKTIDSIGKNLKDDNTFNTYFDKLSEQDDSIEVRDSKEGYYVEGGKVMRGYMAPCLVRLPGEESADIRYAIVFNSNSNNRYWVYIIGNDGQRIGSLLVDKSEIDLNNLDFTNVEGVNNLHDRLSLTDFATIKFLEKENQILNDQQCRLQNLREQASAEVLQSNGTIDENGKVDVSQNLHNSTVTVNAIMDDNITKSKSDIETIVESSRPASEQRLTIEYYAVYDYNNDQILRVQLPTNGNRIKIKEENGKTKDVKFSQSLYKKEGINGVIKSIYGDNIDVLTSSEEEWTGKKSEPKTQKKEETKPVEQTKEKETKERGRSQINKVIRDLKELKSDDYIGKLNAISFYDATIFKLDKNPATKEEQEFIESIREDCKNNGYEIEPLLGKEYNEGMKIVTSFIEDENALENSQIITSVRKPQIMKDGVMIQTADVIVSLGPETSEHTTETPVQEQPAKPVETPKQKAKKEAKKKAKNTASELSKQLAKLEQMEKELEEAAKNNPGYEEIFHSVRTFKNYVQLVRDNYEEMGRPEKVVIDANAIWSINNKLTENLKAIFGNDNVLMLSDEEIENSLTGNEQLSASEGNKNLTQQSSDIQFSSTLSETELIKQKAIADGTFMKAPNGNPTNLTEQQWLQVRTKAFKDWFGDWESANDIESNIDKIDTSKVTIENRPWKGNENKRSIWLSLNNQPEKGAFVLVKDDELNQYSIHFKTATETGEHNTKDTVISTKEERKTLFKEFVKLIPDGAIISTWGEISNDGIRGLNNVGRDMIKIGTRTIKHKDGGVDVEIPIYQKTSNVSKVVDENGEPLVVYHGTKERFDSFRKNKRGTNTATDNNGEFSKENDNIYLSKQNGEIFGYTADGKIVLNNDRIRLDTPVHEYTHLWDQAVQRINPEFWNQGKELMKQSAEWQKVINDPAYANIKDDEDKVASEVHSRLAGYIAAGKSVELYAKDRTKDKRNWFKRLIDWFMKFKDFTLKNIFNMSSADCKQVTLEQFLNAPVADFFMKTDPRKIGKEEIVVQNEEQTIDEPINEESTETLNNVESDHIVETIENKTNELEEQIPQQPLNVSNQEEREVFATIDAINDHNDPPVPLDTYRPAISRFPIGKDNDTRPSYVVLGKGFEYIWNMYNALGAWDYVSQGKLSKDDDIYIGYGKVGENSNTSYYDVVFFVKNGDEYQMIGTLVNKNAPESANKLRNDIKRRYESDKQGMEKITVSAQKASGQFQSGKEFDFYLVKNGDKFLTTKPSKILNGRMQFTDTEYRSLKDVETPDGSKDFNIGFFTPDGLRDNMTTTDKNKAKQFRSASSERSGHCVLIINKPDGDYQLVPLRLAKLSEIINKSNNQVANDFRSIVSDLFDIYKSDKSAVMKNLEIVDSLANGGIITRMSNLVHTNEFSLFYNANNTITVSVNGKKYKNQRFDSVEKMQDFFEDIMKDCLICVNKNTLNNPETLSKYVESDVFSTNLKTTEFANPFYTLMPIDSNGKELDVVNDIQDDNYLDENDITTVLAKFGDKTYAVVDKFGNVKIGVKQFDEFNTSEANRLYSPVQRMRMISYALLKNGMQSNPNDSLFDDYHIDDDENETTLLAHKTMYGDTIFYEVENFTEISPDRVSYYDGEGNLIKLSKPEEIETVDNDDSDVESYEDDDYLEVDLDDEDDVIEVDDEEYIVLDDEDLNDDEIYNEDDDISEESIEVDNESEDKFQEDVNTLMDNELAKGIWAIYETLKLDGGDQNPFDFTLTLGFSEYKYVKDDIRDIGGDKLADAIENLVERYDFKVVSDYAKLFMNSNTKTLEDGFKLVSEEAVRKVLKNNILNKEDDMSKLANKKNDECQL